MSLEGKKVVVVGASGPGIGLATAEAAAARGARLVIASRSMEKLERAKASVEEASAEGEVEAMEVDITDPVSVENFFNEVGNLDHLTVTADPTVPGPFLEQDVELAHRTFGKFWGQFYAARAAAPRVNEGGSIVLFSSAAAKKPPSSGGASLAAVNGAIATLGSALALELAPIRVNVVAPNWVDDEKMDDDQREELREWAGTSLPAGRLGTPEDVAESVLYLMTNRYTTGVFLPVDGGLSVA